ncbi:MAG TPA: VWA domain-containing protein [Pyrinomonadaceae bacterium]|jgi:VWFA-related protein
MRVSYKLLIAVSLLLLLAGDKAAGQAGRRPAASASRERDVLVNIFAAREGGAGELVSAKEISLYDGGVEQTVKSFTPDQGPARIVLLVDNSLSLRTDVEKLAEATREFAYEIYEGDQVMVVGFDEQPEIIADWTDDAKKIEAALPTFRKRGEPRLFDAISAVVDQALRPFAAGNRKRAIVLVSDGLDRGSKTSFDDVLSELQAQDITVYALQIPDRTGGAFRRDRPKPEQALQKLTESTGGRVLSIRNSRNAAQSICDELRKNRYVLAYTPTTYSLTESRRLLVLANEGIQIRSKTMIK